jgi:uncharacterized protein YidB (DUF937 family)
MTESIENLLKGLAGGAAGGAGGSGGGASTIVGSLIKVAESQGGVQNLLSKIGGANSPIASQVSSWIGTGANQPVTGDQVEQSVGADTVAQVAQHAGVSTDAVKSELASALPGLIDKLSPNGQLPELGQLGGLFGKLTGH